MFCGLRIISALSQTGKLARTYSTYMHSSNTNCMKRAIIQCLGRSASAIIIGEGDYSCHRLKLGNSRIIFAHRMSGFYSRAPWIRCPVECKMTGACTPTYERQTLGTTLEGPAVPLGKLRIEPAIHGMTKSRNFFSLYGIVYSYQSKEICDCEPMQCRANRNHAWNYEVTQIPTGRHNNWMHT